MKARYRFAVAVVFGAAAVKMRELRTTTLLEGGWKGSYAFARSS